MSTTSILLWIGAIWLSSILTGGYAQQYGKPINGLFIPLNNTQPSSYGFRIPETLPNRYPNSPNSVGTYSNYPDYPAASSYGNHPVVNSYGKYPAVNSYGRSSLDNGNNNYSIGSDKTLRMGQREPGDKMCLKTIVTKKQKWFRSSLLEKEMEFPDSTSKVQLSRITSVIVEDNTKTGTGGHTKVLKGGVGHPKIRLLFESYPNRNIDLTLTVNCI